ncbi:DNA-binding transcriptional regulator, LysR family [Duganella sp. CF402]|uniref:LysR family transcriptional regulator n=1 Tax=unclassified Duganella TaxID=2636909 RepID=UPI0008C336AC|nr:MULTISPECIES: LysR family transcriptional regulator [unclassified Duganella]RZT04025.1 LysR family transcriptional regulator [Duganella sp. BK701]SEM50980.1 DNA-binding transcriptional regulator, LysR family [Duganella sp. CF402]
MDRFDTLLAFVRVVEAGSFTKAAQTLHMSKTTVSQLVQQLEARLQVKLLHRTTRQVRVTPEGAAYYDRVVRVLGDLEDADNDLTDELAAPRGRLRIDVPSPFARLILMPALPDFHRRYPDIQIDMGVSDRNIDVIGENVDCVVRGGEITVPSLVAKRIGDLKLGLFAAPDYLRREGTPSHPAEIKQIVGFLLSSSGNVRAAKMRRGGEESVAVSARYIVAADDGNAYLAAGLAGMGVLWLPHYMAQPHAARGELTPLLEDWTIDPMPMYLAYPQNRHISAKLRAFMAWIDELMAKI